MQDVKELFARALYNRRKALGLTQDELAERTGTSKQMVSRYELAQRSPKIGMANKFAEALGTTLDELLGMEDSTFSTSQLMTDDFDKPKTAEAITLAKGVDKMPKEQREAILNMMNGLYPGLFEEGKE